MMIWTSTRSLTILACLLFVTLVRPTDAIKTVLAGGEEDCLTFRAAQQAEVLVGFEALPDEGTKVLVTVSKAEAVEPGQPAQVPKRIRTLPAMHSNQLNLTADAYPGTDTLFTCCFANPSRNQPMELIFSIRADVYELMHDLATKEQTAGLYSGVHELARSVQKLMDQQHFTISRELSHREVMENTRNRILRWTIVQALYLTMLCGVQILYIRGMFQSTKTII